MASPESYPRHEDRIALMTDLYIDAAIDLNEALALPEKEREGVIQVYLRLAVSLANEVAGIPAYYEREVRPC